MKIIGITGPTGAGKTTALNALRDLGGCIIDCDAVYHSLLEESAPMRVELVERFGPGILDAGGAVDRKKLGAVVFQHESALRELNAVTHRYVLTACDGLLAAAEAGGTQAAAIDAIALIESGLADRCDAVVGVLAPRELRIRRIMAREGISEAYARLRVEAQKDEAFFRAHCTHILENSPEDTVEAFTRRARALFEELMRIPAR